MGFLSFFLVKHPVTNLIFQDPDDLLKGFRRRTLTLTVIFLTFTFSIINDRLIYPGDNTQSDFDQLRDSHTATDHFIVTIVYSCCIFILEFWLEFVYSLPDRACCRAPCCIGFRIAVYSEVLWVLLINIIVYAVALRDYPEIFLGWLLSYAIYAVIVTPLSLIARYFCFGGKEREKIKQLERERDLGHNLNSGRSENEKLNSISYA